MVTKPTDGLTDITFEGVSVGLVVGLTEDIIEGSLDVATVGSSDDFSDGLTEGRADGMSDEALVGVIVGLPVGGREGFGDGTRTFVMTFRLTEDGIGAWVICALGTLMLIEIGGAIGKGASIGFGVCIFALISKLTEPEGETGGSVPGTFKFNDIGDTTGLDDGRDDGESDVTSPPPTGGTGTPDSGSQHKIFAEQLSTK